MSDFGSIIGDFNANDKAWDADNFAPLPAGMYPAYIVKSEMKDSQKGGKYLKLEVEIIDGQYKGRKVWTNLNLVNSNKQAVEIAKKELAAICRALGIGTPRDSSELHNKPLRAKVVVKPETAEFPAGNEIKGWESMTSKPEAPINVTFAPGSNVGQVAAPATATPASGKKPWEK